MPVPVSAEHDLLGELDVFLAEHESELIEFRRDLHAHPEIGYAEHRTTRRIAGRLEAAGLHPQFLPKGTGLIADIGPGEHATVALRADIDALPIVDEKPVPYRSLNIGACHACGHDVHTSILLGTGLFLARAAAAGALPGKVRLIFQPAEEVPGGALDVMAAGGISSVDRIFALHCDPRLEVGKIGTRTGSITAACDKITVQLSGPGGHTARPHLTADLVFALGKIITELPAALSRRVDPRSGLSLVWGRVSAGTAANAIPDLGVAEGTVRCLDDDSWNAAPDLLKTLVEAVSSSYGVTANLSYERSVPPAVNDAVSTAIVTAAAEQVLGRDAIAQAPQSLGGEDFAWYLESIPGSLFRLGTRRPGGEDLDIHQPAFDADERCIAVGLKVMAATAMTAIGVGADVAGGVIRGLASAVNGNDNGDAARPVRLTGPLLVQRGSAPRLPEHILGRVTTAGRLAPDGTRVYRMTGSLVLWWGWVALAVLALGDLLIQGRDLLSVRLGLGVLTVTGLIFACALWPRVTADDARIMVRNPFRDYDIPWGAVRGIYLGDAVEVQCARSSKKDKTVYCWAITSPRRARARAQMRTTRTTRTPRGALSSSYGRVPESARALAQTTTAELIARELAQLLDERRPEGGAGVLAGRWAWQPLAAVFGPAVALVIAQLVS